MLCYAYWHTAVCIRVDRVSTFRSSPIPKRYSEGGDSTTAIPSHIQLETVLLERTRIGALKVGAKLPSEAELPSRHQGAYSDTDASQQTWRRNP